VANQQSLVKKAPALPERSPSLSTGGTTLCSLRVLTPEHHARPCCIPLATCMSFFHLNRTRVELLKSSDAKRPWSATTIIKSLAVAALFTSLTLSFSAAVFGLVRLALPVLYKLPILPLLLRPFTGHFLRGSYTIFLPFRHLALLSRAWFLGVTTMFIWESSDVLFDAFIPQVSPFI
jgi:hypothetical protein